MHRQGRALRSCLFSFVVMLGLFPVAPVVNAQSTAPGTQSTPARPAPTQEQLAIQAASEKEQRREMDLLGIRTLRPPFTNDPNSPNYTNYEESKAAADRNIPDPLLTSGGTRVTSPEQWWSKRRPEIVELFDREIYGRTPGNLPKVRWEVKNTVHERNSDISVITKTLVGHVDNSADPSITVNIDLTLTTPEGEKRPVPLIMELGLSKEFMAMLAKRFPQFAAATGPAPTWQQQVLARGWGYAEYIPTSVQPDNGAGLTEGIIGLVNNGQPRKVDDWGALKAWAWGASKCIDYFETDPAVDAKQVGVEGHSRYGKAALVAMAYDPRFAIGYISSSGEAGAKLYRHIYGEQVSNVTAANEFHWMSPQFLKYGGPLSASDLPVDNNELIALVAPRPVFISGGTSNGGSQGDGWIDAKGMFLAAAGAGPVYRLLGKRDLGTATFPPIETGLIDGDVAFRQHSGGHTPTPNWPTFIEFATRYLHAAAEQAAVDGSGIHNGRLLEHGEPVPMTAAQDRQRMMVLLGLKDSQMRPILASDPQAPNPVNYEESKAKVYPELPDPLLLNGGKGVTSADEWWSKRRPEIVADFEREILGRAPPNLPRVTWEVTKTAPANYEGVEAIQKTLVGHVDNGFDPQIKIDIQMILMTPAHAVGRVPAILELAFDRDYQDAVAGRRPEPDPKIPGHWAVDWQPVLARGWGFAILKSTSIQADKAEGLTDGIIGLMNSGQPRGLLDWGTLRAWAWGASRALDYLETDTAVDAKQVGLAGHSRFGKTVLVAMAYDPRFAIAYSSSSGEGGAKLYRHIYGEQIPHLAGPLYYWFDAYFLRYAGPLNPGDLPIDNHELIALAAPRPVFIGAGANANGLSAMDGWADAEGMFLATVAAGPVYQLLGAKGLDASALPPVEKALTQGDLAYRQHPYGHTPGPNWPAFLDFASRYLHTVVAAK